MGTFVSVQLNLDSPACFEVKRAKIKGRVGIVQLEQVVTESMNTGTTEGRTEYSSMNQALIAKTPGIEK
jgi:hypothetical protein